MKNTKILALLLIVVFAFSLTLGAFAAPNDPTIAVELKSSTATQVIVNVVIKNNPGFDFCRTDVYYNADVLKFESYDLTGSIVPASKVWNPNATKDKDGVPFINCSIASMMEVFEMVPYTRVSGDGVLATLVFSVIPGATGEVNIYATTKSANFFVKNGAEYVYTEPVETAGVTVSVKNGEITGSTAPSEPTTPPTEPTVPPTEPTVPPTEPTVPPTEPTVPECVHANKTERVVSEATCVTPGSKVVFCNDCGYMIDSDAEIPATGKHTEEVIPGFAATCGKEGLSDGKKCSVCGEILEQQKPINPTGNHTEERINAVPATCTATGMSAGSKCSVCDAVIVAPHETPKADHTPVIIPGKAASCGVAGLTDGEKCSSCGEIIKAQTEIPAISDHDYVEESRVEADCLTNGTITEKCSICGDKKTTVLPTPGHNSVVIEGKEATCTEPGLSDGEKCSVCGAIIVAQKEVPVVPHTFGEWLVTKEATCKETGLKVRSCVCGESESDVIPVVEHVIVADAAVAATCTKTGLTAGEHCSVCNEVIVAQKEVAKLEHDFKKDSENEDGTIYKCSACGETSFVPHEENPPTTDNVVYAIVALVLMSASALVIFNGKKWTIG